MSWAEVVRRVGAGDALDRRQRPGALLLELALALVLGFLATVVAAPLRLALADAALGQAGAEQHPDSHGPRGPQRFRLTHARSLACTSSSSS